MMSKIHCLKCLTSLQREKKNSDFCLHAVFYFLSEKKNTHTYTPTHIKKDVLTHFIIKYLVGETL